MSRSKSKSSSSNSSTTYDQRTTESINAGIGGDIEDSTVVSGVRGNVNLTNTVTDHGAIDAAADIAEGAFDFGTDAIEFSEAALDTVADSQERAFEFGESAVSGVIGFGGDAISEALDFGADVLGENAALVDKVLAANAEQQTEVLDSANRLTELSMANLAAIKSGETIAQAADRNLLEIKDGLLVAAGITAAAVIGAKMIEGKK